MQGFWAIYRYTSRKYFKSPATWIIMTVSALGIGFTLGGVIPFIFITLSDPEVVRNYIRGVVAAISAVSTFMSTFIAVYAGFLSARLYRDEIENGTFLTIIAKPINRSTIIFGKWASLLSLIALYCFTSIFFYGIGISIFDIGSKIPGLSIIAAQPIGSNIAEVCVFLFLIVFISGLIFSSIGLLISTKLSVAATIGALVSLGIIIPLSSLLGTFLRKEPVKSFTNTNYAVTINQYPRVIESFRNELVSTAANLAPENSKPFFNDPSFQKAFKNRIFPQMEKQVSDFTDFIRDSHIAEIGLAREQDDYYSKVYWADLNLQFTTLAQLAYQKSLPVDIKSQLIGANVSSVLSNEKVEIDRYLKVNDVVDLFSDFYRKYDPIASAAWQLYLLKLIFTMRLGTPEPVSSSGLETPNRYIPFELFFSTRRVLAQYFSFFQDLTFPETLKVLYDEIMAQNFTDEAQFTKIDGGSVDGYVAVSRRFLLNILLFMTGLPSLDTLLGALGNAALSFAANPESANFTFLNDLTNFSLLKSLGQFTANDEDITNQIRFYINDGDAFTSFVTSASSRDFLFANGARVEDAIAVEGFYNQVFQAIKEPLYYQLYFYDRVFDRSETYLTRTIPGISSITSKPIYAFSSYRDIYLINQLLYYAKNDELVTYKIGDYLNRNNLLIAYILVALVLVPLTYPIIKRQDFR